MMWLGSASLGSPSNIFTGVTYTGYGPPDGFCFDPFCDDPPIQDNPDFEDYNVEGAMRAPAGVRGCLTPPRRPRESVREARAGAGDALPDRPHHAHDGLGAQSIRAGARPMGAHRVRARRTSSTRTPTSGTRTSTSSSTTSTRVRRARLCLVQRLTAPRVDGRVNAFYSTPSIYLDNLNSEGATWCVSMCARAHVLVWAARSQPREGRRRATTSSRTPTTRGPTGRVRREVGLRVSACAHA